MEGIQNAGLSNVPLSCVNENETKRNLQGNMTVLEEQLEQLLPLIMRLFRTQNITK